MASSLFPQQPTQNNGIFSRLNSLKQIMGGNPQAVYDDLMRNNPQFQQFMQQNKGKTPEQVARENGIDLDAVRSFFG